MSSPTIMIIAVINSLGAAAALAAGTWLALEFATKMNAATRFAIWWAVLGAVLVLPAAPRMATAIQDWLRPVTIPSARPLYAPSTGSGPLIDVPALLTVHQRGARGWPAGLGAVWALVFLYRLAKVVRSYVHLAGLKRKAIRATAGLPV